MASVKKMSELWDQLPSFTKSQKTVRAEVKNSSEVVDAYANPDEWRDEPIEKANMITSKCTFSGQTGEYHMPILDLDFDAKLIPSSTPGHWHLYLDRALPKDTYFKLLEALAEADIIQHGFLVGAKKRGATSVRLPWIKKGDKKANMLNPDGDKKRIEAAIEFHSKILDGLKAKLAGEDEVITAKSISVAPITKSGIDGEWKIIGTTTDKINFESLDKDIEW